MGDKKVALIGAQGMLASQVRALAPVEVEIHCFDLPEFDLTDAAAVATTLASLQPQIIINCAAFTNVDGCESNAPLAFLVNGEGPGHLAAAAKQIGSTLVHISTDYVFAGTKNEPYEVDDAPDPQSIYGQSKLAGEQAILNSGLEHYFMVRTSWLYGPDGNNFVETILRLAGERDDLGIVSDQIGSPTYTGDLAEALWRLLATDDYGVYHFSNHGECSWYEFAREIIAQAKLCGLPLKLKTLRPIRTEDYPLPARRPAYSLLSKDRYLQVTGASIPFWRDSLQRYFAIR
ncbi:MAG: dTDP-4-dehydrorhamnose reductase [Desulfuromonadales bacterium]|nr:dTDP-4-dehydrorhamnose reductase [Desulfuromonadales bacterium]